MEYKVLIFGGTTEARLLTEYLIESKIQCIVSVTSEYAKNLLEKSSLLHVIINRLNECEMKNYIQKINPSIIVDATHPYAIEVSKNIKTTCCSLNKEYLTVIRDLGTNNNFTTFKDVDMLADYLQENCFQEDIVLSTLGIKESQAICSKFYNFKKQLYLRILPSLQSLSKAIDLGIPSKNIICMQGPFSKEMNVALINEIGAKYLLTKITGKVGGFVNKIEAAQQCGVKVLAISPPCRENGLNLDDAKNAIMRKVKEDMKDER